MSIQVTGTVESVVRLRNDSDGNPRYRLQLDVGLVYETSPRSLVAYTIDEQLVGQTVTLTIASSGDIVGLARLTLAVLHEFHGDISLAGYGPDCFHVKCFDCGAEYRFQPRAHIDSWIHSHTLVNGINIFACKALRAPVVSV